MELFQFFKSVLEQDTSPIVLCDLKHTIIYMNPAACHSYAKSGGAQLLGSSLLDCHNDASNKMIKKVVQWFAESKDHNQIHTFYNQKEKKDVYMVALRDVSGDLIGYYEKHEYRSRDEQPRYQFT